MTRLGAAVVMVSGALLLSACGSANHGSSTDLPAPTKAALETAGWKVAAAEGMAPLAGGRQLAFLDATSPSGYVVSLQFLDSPARAKSEVVLIHQRPSPFTGVAVGSVLAFSAPAGAMPVPQSVLAQVVAALRTS